MKKITLIFAMLLGSTYLMAQTCKIKIYYDENGSRTQRVLKCQGEKPAPENATQLAETHPDLNRLAGKGFQVYPNPANDQVNVKLDNAFLAQGTSIIITELSGKVLQQQKVSSPLSTFLLHGYADGVYFITIVSGNDRHVIKIVKQNGSK